MRRLWPVVVSLLATSCASPPPEVHNGVPLATATPDEAPPDDTGTLEILSTPASDVLVDGKPAGHTPIVGYKVAPGSHDVTFVDPDAGNRTMTIKVAPGEGRTVKLDRVPSIQEKKR